MGLANLFVSQPISLGFIIEVLRSDLTPSSIDYVLDLLLPIVLTLIASSGFWLWLDNKRSKKTFENELLVGLAHDRIIYLGMTYIARGYILQEEYENLYDYLYKPYEKMGGNGSARRVMLEVEKLPIRKLSSITHGEYKNEIEQQDLRRP